MDTAVSPGGDLEELRRIARSDVQNLRQRITELSQDSMDLIISGARSHYAWTDKKVSETQIREIYEIVKTGATSMNSCPARFVFVQSIEGKEKLAKALKPTNIPKVMGSPLTVIVAYDLDFWKELPRLFPHEDRRGHFSDKPVFAEETAFRNSTLQGGYLMTAARAIGLDIGPLSGFSNEIVDKEFFAGSTLRSNFLCNIGYADESALFQKLPRFDFEDVCSFC